MKNLKLKIWSMLNRKKISEMKLLAKPGAILEDGFGEQFEVVSAGRDGIEIKKVKGEDQGMFSAILGTQRWTPSWSTAALHLVVAMSASDSVEDAISKVDGKRWKN